MSSSSIGIFMLTKLLRVFLTLWIFAPLAIVLTLSLDSKSLAASDRAQIWMMTSAVFAWCSFSLILLATCKYFGLLRFRAPKLAILRCCYFIGFATALALVEEICTQFMTNHAPFFGVAIGKAFITPSLCYWDTVLHHSVIIFVPMFTVCAILAEKWQFSPKEIFYLTGGTGLAAEMTMNPASLFMGFWILVYGFMVLVPAIWLYRDRRLAKRHWWHYPSAVLLMLFAGAIASFTIHAIYPQHPDNHFTVNRVTFFAIPPCYKKRHHLCSNLLKFTPLEYSNQTDFI